MPYKDKTSVKAPWIAQIRINGKKVKHRCTTRKEAIEWEIREKKWVQEQPSETCSICLLDWANSYLQFAQKNFVKKTFVEKRLAFKMLFQDIDPALQADHLAPLLVLRHFEHQSELKSGNAVNKQRKNLIAAWNWGIKFLGFSRDDPFSRIAKYAELRTERRVPSLAEFWQVVSVAETEQDRLMLLTYLQTGARREELYRLQWKDVDFGKNQIRLFWRKNQVGQWRSVWLPIKSELAELLQTQRRVTGLKQFVFLNPVCGLPFVDRNKWMPRLCRKAGVQPFGIHGIRHLFASILAASNIPLVEIQRMLRHNSLSTTQRYIHSLKNDARDVLQALPDLEQKAPLKAPNGLGELVKNQVTT